MIDLSHLKSMQIKTVISALFTLFFVVVVLGLCCVLTFSSCGEYKDGTGLLDVYPSKISGQRFIISSSKSFLGNLCLPIQGTPDQFLVWEYSRATEHIAASGRH